MIDKLRETILTEYKENRLELFDTYVWMRIIDEVDETLQRRKANGPRNRND